MSYTGISELPKTDLLVNIESLIDPSKILARKSKTKWSRSALFSSINREDDFDTIIWDYLQLENNHNIRYSEIVIDLSLRYPWKEHIADMLNGIANAFERGYYKLRVNANIVVSLSEEQWSIWSIIKNEFESNPAIKPYWKGFIYKLNSRNNIPSEIIDYCKTNHLHLIADATGIKLNSKLVDILSETVDRVILDASVFNKAKEMEILYKSRCPLVVPVPDYKKRVFDHEFPAENLTRILHTGLCLNFASVSSAYHQEKPVQFLLDSKEIRKLANEDLFMLLRNGIEASLLDEDQKYLLYKELNAYLDPEDDLLENL